MTRDGELETLFAETLGAFVGILEPLKLSPTEQDDFEERTFLWFERFTRRPGHEAMPAEKFVIPLLSAACRLARQTAEAKSLKLPLLVSEAPEELGIQLGLIEEIQRP
jgi:hypothetical protein